VQFWTATIARFTARIGPSSINTGERDVNELSLETFKALPLNEQRKLGNWRRMSPMDQARFQADERRQADSTAATVADASTAASNATVAATVARIAENWFLASGFTTRINEARAAALNPVVARILENYGAASGIAKS
jgi:hypothetical protein